MSNGEFEMVFDFGIDDGSLDGLPPQMCFVLGYEIGVARQALLSSQEERSGFGLMIHSVNSERVERLVAEMGAVCEVKLIHDDWAEVIVGWPDGGEWGGLDGES